MNEQNLIIYKFTSLFHILEELSSDLNFNIISVNDENTLKDKIKNFNYYLVLSNKKYPDINNQFVLDNKPINIFKFIEKMNIEFLKQQFNNQSKFKINQYIIDLNSRELILNDLKLKLTEKEINTIIYISKSNKPVSIDELQEKVWSYQSDIETHTVETHIYRLRKKILSTFSDAYPNLRISYEDIFYYVYGILHSKDYRKTFKTNLNKEIPRIPILKSEERFGLFAKAGKSLSDIHVNFENVEKYPLNCEFQLDLVEEESNEKYFVEKMKFASSSNQTDKSKIIVNKYITLSNIPLNAYEYTISNSITFCFNFNNNYNK